MASRSSILLRASYNHSFWEFPKLGVPFWGVPIVRTVVFWGPYWGPPILGSYLFGMCLFGRG